MTKVNVSYSNFSTGEISPKLYGRFDLAAYYSGHKRVENFTIDSTGQATYRNGTVFAGETAGNNKAFIYPFVYNASISYILEFTDQKLRFYSNDGQVTSGGLPYELTTPFVEADLFQLKFAQDGTKLYIAHPNYNPQVLEYTSATSWTITNHSPIRETLEDFQVITSATQADPCVITYTGSDSYTNGDFVKITGVSGMTQLNDRIFEIDNVNTGSNTFELVDVDATGYTTYSSGGVIQEISQAPAPFLVSGQYPAAVSFFEDRLVYGGSTDSPNVLYFSRTPSTITGRRDYTDDFTIGEEVDDGMEYFVSGDGNNVRWLRGTSKFLAVGTFGDVLQVTGGIDGVITPDSISVRPSNSYGVLDINSIGKNTNVFYIQNNGVVMRSFEYEFESDTYIPVDRNVIADHITKGGLTQMTFQEGRPNTIWGVRNDGQMVGMTIEESEGINGWHRQVTDGEFVSVASLPRENKDNQLWVCVKRTIDGNTKYYIEYFNDTPTYPNIRDFFTSEVSKTDDFARYANKMFEAQKEYIHVDSCLTYTGDLAGIDASASVTPAATTGTSVTFTASASVFNSGDVGREVWKKSTTGEEEGRAVIVSYVSGTEVTCDIVESFNNTDSMAAGDWYLTTDSVSGLDHLEGETLTVVADGGQHPQKTVSGGVLTLDRQVSVAHIGLGYSGYIETNSLEGGGTNGTSQTKRKSVHSVGVRFLESLFAEVGDSYYTLEQIYERRASMKMDRPPLLYTGDKKINIINRSLDDYDSGWERTKSILIRQSLPFPCNVQMLVPYMDVSNI